MLNKDKIILMTKLAVYEKGEGKKEIPMSKYYQNDYVGIHMLGTFITTTIALLLIAVLYVMRDAEGFLSSLTSLNLKSVLFLLGLIYMGSAVLYLLVSWLFYRHRFKKNRVKLNEYHGNLKKLTKLQEADQRKVQKIIQQPEKESGETEAEKTEQNAGTSITAETVQTEEEQEDDFTFSL